MKKLKNSRPFIQINFGNLAKLYKIIQISNQLTEFINNCKSFERMQNIVKCYKKFQYFFGVEGFCG